MNLLSETGLESTPFKIRAPLPVQSLPDDLPYLMELVGDVVGVGFEPGKTEVKIKTDDISQATLSATSDQVETALELRHESVRALAVKTSRTRLLRVQSLRAPAVKVTPEYIDKHIFQRWDTLLRRLAE